MAEGFSELVTWDHVPISTHGRKMVLPHHESGEVTQVRRQGGEVVLRREGPGYVEFIYRRGPLDGQFLGRLHGRHA